MRATWRGLAGCAVGLGCLAAGSLQAFVLVPMSMDFDAVGRGATRTFRVANDATNSVPIQISILTREMDPDGKESNRPADDDFTVYPMQVTLGPKQSQSIRVTYVGKADQTAELSYRIVAEQLPVAMNREQSRGAQVNILLRYLGSIYVTAKGATPDVVLESAALDRGAEGKSKLVVTLRNRGRAHALLALARLRLSSAGGTGAAAAECVLEGESALSGLLNENMLAGHTRRFALPWPEQLPPGPVTGRLEYTPQR